MGVCPQAAGGPRLVVGAPGLKDPRREADETRQRDQPGGAEGLVGTGGAPLLARRVPVEGLPLIINRT